MDAWRGRSPWLRYARLSGGRSEHILRTALLHGLSLRLDASQVPSNKAEAFPELASTFGCSDGFGSRRVPQALGIPHQPSRIGGRRPDHRDRHPGGRHNRVSPRVASIRRRRHHRRAGPRIFLAGESKASLTRGDHPPHWDQDDLSGKAIDDQSPTACSGARTS